ncbi:MULTISPECIES: hypothetical protein [unclassified Sinorhizobium]|uniref:hypothetical protein n=1 Tax=unclassified Sinorhizobium TaxID=2613772 RepID=UPI0024C245E8|nr:MULTISPECIES: hypothetical protein [unclassified Sinorhizobium]MDK1376442.1 hypothetical protein [Sinorhizobium sp. 6-70]MDK1483189.1 hypothetical protein [Sinorhizobium sp. 6-117]
MRVIGSGSVLPAPKRVVSTGLAVVHENELVYPAAGSAAQAEAVIEDARATVQVVFPVEIEILAGGGEAEIRDSIETAMRRTAARLDRLG